MALRRGRGVLGRVQRLFQPYFLQKQAHRGLGGSPRGSGGRGGGGGGDEELDELDVAEGGEGGEGSGDAAIEHSGVGRGHYHSFAGAQLA